MRRALLAAGLTIVLGAAAVAGEAPPWKTMRALQGLEDRIAAGDSLAQAARTKAILRLGQGFAAMPPETWADLRNARALVAYLFGGGDAAETARAISPEGLHKDAVALYRGALAYAGGDDDTAREQLSPIDAKTLPPGLAGHLALVQAALIAPTDKPRAEALLDLARLLEPGTLVEEAALRKEMSLIGADGDFDKLPLLERRYQAAFARSVYADNFKQLVGDLAAKIADVDLASGNDRLARLLAPLPRDDRRRLFLAIARREALAGHLVAATFAALEGGRLVEAGSRDAARASLYFGASAVVGPTYDKAVAALAAAQPDHLEARDRTLRIAALDMAATIRAAAGTKQVGADEGDPIVLHHGAEALNAADAALRGGSR